jgi:hypothetical protein
MNRRICECNVFLPYSSVVSLHPSTSPNMPKKLCFPSLKSHPINASIIICIMELHSLAQAPGLSIHNFDLKRETKINVFSSSVSWGKNSVFRFKYSSIQKLHLPPGDIVKKTEGGPKLYRIENNLVIASVAASSLYGTFLHAARTACINLVDVLVIPELMSILVFFG